LEDHSSLQNAVLFNYRKGHGREGLGKMLREFKGYIQSDRYKVFDWFGKKANITLLNCWVPAFQLQHKMMPLQGKNITTF
jgi:transposase